MIGTRVCGLDRSLVPILGVLQPLRANSKKTVESSPPGPGTRLHFSAPLMPSAASTSHDKTMTLAERAGSSVEPSRPASWRQESPSDSNPLSQSMGSPVGFSTQIESMKAGTKPSMCELVMTGRRTRRGLSYSSAENRSSGGEPRHANRLFRASTYSSSSSLSSVVVAPDADDEIGPQGDQPVSMELP